MDDNEQFIRFIIKNIIKTIDYDVENDAFIIDRVYISDELINRIVAEGSKYGLESGDVRELITIVSSEIKTDPSVHRSYDQVRVRNITAGKHLRLNAIHDEYGPMYIEMVCIEPLRFFVISSDIPGVRYQDELVSINEVWNISYGIDFRYISNGEVYPNQKDLVLKFSKLKSIEYIFPSIVHEIFDSQEDFVKEDSPEDAIIQYIWTPKRHAPIAFSLSDEESDLKHEAVFQIRRSNKNATTAFIRINPQIVMPDDYDQRRFLLDAILECCCFPHVEENMGIKETELANEEYFFSEEFKKKGRFATMEEGLLQLKETTGLWVLTKKPVVDIQIHSK